MKTATRALLRALRAALNVAPASPPLETAEMAIIRALLRQTGDRLARPAWERRICR
jgi:hypothetical protein